ncbi:unnamed protein product, partial [Heterosigma akashiwo]
QNRSLPPDAPDKFPWLKYSPSTRSVYCGCCFLRHGFDPRYTPKAETWGDLVKKGYNNWQMFGRKATAHSGSRIYGNCRHVDSVGHAKDLHQVLKNPEDGIDVQLDNVLKEQQKKNTHLLERATDNLTFLARQGLPKRGNQEYRGNFHQLMKKDAKHDPILQEFQRISRGDYLPYTSHDVQDELVLLIADQIMSKYLEEMKASPFLALIGDECSDISRKDQLGLCIRYVYGYHERRSNRAARLVTREDFIKFKHATRKTAEHLYPLILAALREMGLEPVDVRWQGYDGSKNFAGKHSGVQARFKIEYPQADFSYCKGHNLQRCLVRACEFDDFDTFFKICLDVTLIFFCSNKRTQIFAEQIEGEDAAELEELGALRGLIKFCETRWLQRSESLQRIKKLFKTLLDGLEELASVHKDSGARQAKTNMGNFDFVITLCVVCPIFLWLHDLSKTLQDSQIEMHRVPEACNVARTKLEHLRNNTGGVWDAVYDEALALAGKSGI